MSRPIKFRAWHPEEKKMFYSQHDGVAVPGMRGDSFIPYVSGHRGGFKDHVSLEIMQFTGLKDKHGKEIYEGDILSMDSWEPKNVQVKFIEGAFCLANGKGEYVGDIHYINHADRPQSTVIGNIYQNPELCP